MFQYKLIVVDENGQQEYSIGTFKDEYALEQWAHENQGELDKTQE